MIRIRHRRNITNQILQIGGAQTQFRRAFNDSQAAVLILAGHFHADFIIRREKNLIYEFGRQQLLYLILNQPAFYPGEWFGILIFDPLASFSGGKEERHFTCHLFK